MVETTIVNCPHRIPETRGEKAPQIIIGGRDCPHWIPKGTGEKNEELDKKEKENS